MDCVAYVSYFEGKLKVDIITVENAIVLFTNLTYANGKAFIDALPSFTHYKAMILHIYDNQSHGYSNNFEFCEAVRNELQKLKIKYMFVARAYFFMSSFFVAANFTDINIGDTVLSVVLENDNIICNEFKFTKNGYIFTENKAILELPNLNRPPEDIRKEILLSTNPNKIIFCVSPSPLVEPLKKILKPNFCFDLVEKILDMAYETVVELYKRMIDKSDVKRFIVPTSPRRYGFGYKIGEKSYHYINVSESDPLPICKIFTVRRLSYEMVMNAYNDGNTELINLQRFTLPKNAHRFDITFIVDEDGFASHKIEPKMAEEIQIFQETLNKSAHQRPFIAFFDNVSVIFVYKEGKGYQCLDSWGGIYGRDLLIAFDKRKPTFCDDALEALRKKPSSAITDFVELLTLTPGEQPNRPLPFKITSDAKNPILIEFDSYDGSKKAATPIFLMALLLKQHIKALEAEGFTKGGLKHIGFSLGGCESKKTELFHKNIKESCALLKIHWTNHP